MREAGCKGEPSGAVRREHSLPSVRVSLAGSSVLSPPRIKPSNTRKYLSSTFPGNPC
jgi:hypothetical protein